MVEPKPWEADEGDADDDRHEVWHQEWSGSTTELLLVGELLYASYELNN